jgi:hypothetical protein
VQKHSNLPALVEDNRSRSFRPASISRSDPLLDQSTTEIRVDKAVLGPSYRFPAVLVRYTIAASVPLKRL